MVLLREEDREQEQRKRKQTEQEETRGRRDGGPVEIVLGAAESGEQRATYPYLDLQHEEGPHAGTVATGRLPSFSTKYLYLEVPVTS